FVFALRRAEINRAAFVLGAVLGGFRIQLHAANGIGCHSCLRRFGWIRPSQGWPRGGIWRGRPRPRSGTKEHLRHGGVALDVAWTPSSAFTESARASSARICCTKERCGADVRVIMTRVEQAFRPAYGQLIKNCHPERSATGCERSELEREREVEGPWFYIKS